MKVSAEFTSTITRILDSVAGQCDGALTRDGSGFNRTDLSNGVNDLIEYLHAEQPTELKAGTVKWLLFMAVFYQRQWLGNLPEGTLERIKAMQAIVRKA